VLTDTLYLLMDSLTTLHSFLFAVIYGGVTLTAVFAACYLLFRQGNAFAKDVDSPIRLRRYAAAFLMTIALSHVWWLLLCYTPLYGTSEANIPLCIALDIATTLPTLLLTLNAMLQDRKRPAWPVIPIVAIDLLNLWTIQKIGSAFTFIPILLFIVLVIFITLMLIHDVKEYGHWLRENYADMEHKEVWKSFIVFTGFLLTSIIYFVILDDASHNLIIDLMDLMLIIVLLWRVENLQKLEAPVDESIDTDVPISSVFAKIEIQLKTLCVEEKYYLRHDVSLSHLAKLIGTNSTYLSQYFSMRGLSYNTYINGLRIQHFIRLYQDAVTEGRIFTASQLAFESGFRSYSTFSTAFKQAKNETVTDWMNRPSAK